MALGVQWLSMQALVGSLVGVLTGELLSMAWDRRQRRRETEQREELTRRTLREELRAIGDRLEADEEYESYPTAAYRSSVSSGRFSLLGTALQQDVSEVYALVDRVETTRSHLHEARLRGDDDEYLHHLRVEYHDQVEALAERVSDVASRLGSPEGDGDATGAEVAA